MSKTVQSTRNMLTAAPCNVCITSFLQNGYIHVDLGVDLPALGPQLC
uniref:Mastadenovirus sus4 E3 region, pVIII n=1 Tax=Porcine adenovirus B serotype 4 TaxID=35267 RepID=Q64850_ADEP4|nr:ORF3 [Porcine adenovirus 4]